MKRWHLTTALFACALHAGAAEERVRGTTEQSLKPVESFATPPAKINSNTLANPGQWLPTQERRLSAVVEEQELRQSSISKMPKEELAAHFRMISSARQQRRGVLVARSLADLCATQVNSEQRLATMTDLKEVLSSTERNGRPPIQPHYDFFAVPLAFLSRINNGIARGTEPATNLGPSPGHELDLADPLPSTFWHRPISISTQDLYHGFGRLSADESTTNLWEYRSPKISYGINPGFEAQCGSSRVRLKFGDRRTEPFTARIFWALGYNVDPTDYCEGLKIKYDRRLFREFNLRREIQTQFRFLSLPLYTLKLQKRHDPFSFISQVVLKDGRRLSGEQLKHELLFDPWIAPEDDPNNFRSDFETLIDHLVTVPANIQGKSPSAQSIGPWSFDDCRHEDLRELRGAGLLAAWIGWYDSRFHNTRLKRIKGPGAPGLLHYFSDLGGGLGKANGWFSGKSDRPNDFGWTFTEAPKTQGKGKMTLPFRIMAYRPMEKNRAFEQMTFEDARWMGRQIAQLTEPQIQQALLAAGFDSSEVRLYGEKLISRRDRMVCDLGLTSEIPLLRPSISNRKFDYDPRRDGLVRIRISSGEEIRAPFSGQTVAKGRLMDAFGEGAKNHTAEKP